MFQTSINQALNESQFGVVTNRAKMSIYSGSKSKISFKHIKDTDISPESDDDSELDGFEEQDEAR
jgi:hypothetical protein